MTIEEMTQQTPAYWSANFPKSCARIPEEDLLRDAVARAELTRMEMDTIKLVAPDMTDEEAWSESRGIFCITSGGSDGASEYDDDEEDDE
ncbi:MAG: hypothetical protein HUJ86_07310 [Synergistes sp.]|nr:hypothetical protein [Synergistes sp.]